MKKRKEERLGRYITKKEEEKTDSRENKEGNDKDIHLEEKIDSGRKKSIGGETAQEEKGELSIKLA